MPKLILFLRHALAHLSRERQRTLFVLFCIAAGVAAVVALRTMGLMIQEALTGNFQAANRGDIVIHTPNSINSTAETDATVDHSMFEAQGGSTWDIQDITLSASGVARLEEWAGANGFEIMFVWAESGPFTRIYQPGNDRAAGFVMTRFVPPDHYPFYDTVRILTPPGMTLAQALSEPFHVVISQDLARDLDLQVGDPVNLTGSARPFQVAAIADPQSEASLRNVFASVFAFMYAPYETGVDILGKQPNVAYLRVPTGTDVSAVQKAFIAEFPDLSTITTEDLCEWNSEVGETLTKLVTVMGLVSLLIGGIGIANTMVVVVSRRNLEIAVLKTVGVRGRQVALMFIVEASILGLLGSLVGIGLGLGLVLVLRGFGERFVAQPLQFVVYPEALGMGLVLGVVVTLAFSLLPTLAAGQVRPKLLLRPQDRPVPQTGRLPSLLVLLGLTALMGLVVGQILGELPTGLLGAALTVAGLGIGLSLLRLLVWGLSRLPALGSASLKLAQRAVDAQKGRAANTMLALIVGLFSLSLILLLTQGTLKLLSNTLEGWIGGNVLVAVRSLEVGEALENRMATLPGVLAYEHDTVYVAEIVAVDGDRDVTALVEQAKQSSNDPEWAAGFINGLFTGFDVKVLEKDTWSYQVVKGRDIVSGPRQAVDDPAGLLLEPSVYDPDGLYGWLGFEPGTRLTLRFAGGVERTATVAGITAEHESGILAVSNFRETHAIVPPGFVPEGMSPVPSFYAVTVVEDQMNETLTALSEVQGTFVVETSQMTVFAQRMLDQFASLPLVVAALALFAAGTIIANTVSLATLERRRQIGIMKALGLSSRRVLGLLLLENSLVGLAGGVIGVALGAIAISTFDLLGKGAGNLPLGTMALLVALAVGVAWVATLLTAYGASQEKPLNVLRYE